MRVRALQPGPLVAALARIGASGRSPRAELVAWPNVASVVLDVLERAHAEDRELTPATP